MCIIFPTLTWPENPAGAISEVLNSKISSGDMPPDPPKRVWFHTLPFCTLCSNVYVALPVPKQLPYSAYATAFAMLPVKGILDEKIRYIECGLPLQAGSKRVYYVHMHSLI